MENRGVLIPPILRRIGATRTGTYITCGYVTKSGRYVTVEGTVEALCGRDGTVTGIRLRMHGKPTLPPEWERYRGADDRYHVPLGLDGLERGWERRQEELSQRSPLAAQRDRYQRPATARQLAYLRVLAGRAGEDVELADLTQGAASKLIDALEAELRDPITGRWLR
ncbi:DUF3072 domain-containing protein (plasmid) [Thermobispora bispora]|nr:DUF3072 domain-containing protein [Thermobispora bispora]QSI50044.1 DUF3072 domain-containing protein [Thermobispora bispora]